VWGSDNFTGSSVPLIESLVDGLLPAAISRLVIDSVGSLYNHKATLRPDNWRQIVLNIFPRNFFGSEAVANTSRL